MHRKNLHTYTHGIFETDHSLEILLTVLLCEEVIHRRERKKTLSVAIIYYIGTKTVVCSTRKDKRKKSEVRARIHLSVLLST